MHKRKIQTITLIIGIFFFLLSLFQAVILNYPHFYTSFALGSWLILDWIDYRLTNYSTLGYFINKKHWDAFLLFFVITGVFCFVIDILYGVHITKLWKWSDYGHMQFLRMIIIMNTAFLFSVVELYRIVSFFFSKKINDVNVFKIKLKKNTNFIIYSSYILVSIVGFILPIISAKYDLFPEYTMFLPFLSMFLICESISYFTKGKTYTEQILRGNIGFYLSFIVSWLIIVPITEYVNLSAREWVYLNMPFQDITINSVPLAVYMGWIPLMLAALSSMYLVKHIDYLHDNQS